MPKCGPLSNPPRRIERTRVAELAKASLLTTRNAASPLSAIRRSAGAQVGRRRRVVEGPWAPLTEWTATAAAPTARTAAPWFTGTGQSSHHRTGVHPRNNDPFSASRRDRYGDEGKTRRTPISSNPALGPAATPLLTPT